MQTEQGDAIVKNTDAQQAQTKKKKRRPKKPKVAVPVGDTAAEKSPKDSLDVTGNTQEKQNTKPKRPKKKKTGNTGECPTAAGSTDAANVSTSTPTTTQVKKVVNNPLPVELNGENSQRTKPDNKHFKSQKTKNPQAVAPKTNSAGNAPQTGDLKYSTKTNPSGLLNSKQNIDENTEMNIQKNRDEVLAARAAKKAAKQTKKGPNTPSSVEQTQENKVLSADSQSLNISSKKNEAKSVTNTVKPEESGEDILVQREPNKIAKVNKSSTDAVATDSTNVENSSKPIPVAAKETDAKNVPSGPKSREEILAEREAKKLAKQIAKNKSKAKVTGEEGSVANANETEKTAEISPAVKTKSEGNAKKAGEVKPQLKMENRSNAVENVPSTEAEQKKKATTKAERRALQEAQREAKAKQQTLKAPAKKDAPKADGTPKSTELAIKSPEKTGTVSSVRKLRTFKAKLFDHLEARLEDQSLFVNHPHIHPAMVTLGEQYAKRTVVGCNARCIAFLHCLKIMIRDFETPPKKEFGRCLEESIKICIGHLNKCRPLAVSVINASNYIKVVLTKLPSNKPESDLKKYVLELIDIYIKDQFEKAAEAISSYVQAKISDGDVILTYGCSSLIHYILEEAQSRGVDFRVIVVDSRPFSEGHELLRRLTGKGIACTCVLINAIGFIMPEVTKILLGAHSLLANGYVMSRTGTAQVALVAKSFNVPVLVCCETHKFSERVQTDAIVYNELGNPNDLVSKTKDCILSNWEKLPSLHPLNLNYDVTPPELVSAVVTEVAILPCTSVPVILRIRPTEMIV